MNKPLPVPSFEEIRKYWESNARKAHLNEEEIEDLIHSLANERLLELAPFITCLIDLQSSQYLYMSKATEKVLGYHPKDFLQGGVARYGERVHEEDLYDLVTFTRQVFQYLYEQPAPDRKNYTYSVTYRLRKKDGHYVTFLQQNTLANLDPQGNITHLLSILSDISHLITDHLVKGYVLDGHHRLRLRYKSAWSPNASEDFPTPGPSLGSDFLTLREREVLRLLADGNNSQEVADTLHISITTVNTHRRNMLRKTGTRNTNALIKYALQQGLF